MNFPNFIHTTTLRINRRIARPVLGHLVGEESFAAIGQAFRPHNVTAEALTVDAGTPFTSERAAAAQKLLGRYGIVVLRNFIAPPLADAARREADQFMAHLHRAMQAPSDHGDVDGVLWQVGGARLAGHSAILGQNRPVVNMRSRERGTVNGGIVDLFFIDRAAREHGWGGLSACIARMGSEMVTRLVASVSPARLAHMNMLRSDGVTATRGLHVDNLDGSYKLFVYLSDVAGLDDGPYAYVPGSHRCGGLLRREARLNTLCGRPENDSHSFDGYEMPLPVPKGTAILSCQSGVHRGMPQREGASRTVLVAKFA